MDKKYEITPEFIKDLYNIGCVPDLKATLEKHFAEVLKKPVIKQGSVFIGGGTGDPYIYIDSEKYIRFPHCMLDFWRETLLTHPMRSGTITITVKDGMVAGAVVNEKED